MVFILEFGKRKNSEPLFWCELVEKPFDKRQLTNNVGSQYRAKI